MAHFTNISLPARLLLCLLLVPQSLFAGETSSTPNTRAFPVTLQPAEAQYRVVVNGIPVGLNATIRLTRLDQGYQLHFKVENRLFRHEERARFHWHDCTATPQHYRHASAGFGIRREGEIHFDWDNRQANGSKADYPLLDGTLDALSVAMVARCNMARADDSFSYQVAEPDGMAHYKYRSLGEDTVETPAGEWHASGLERDYPERGRQSQFWAAQELDYFMIRMDHRENPFIRGRIELTDFRYLPDGT